MASLGLWPRITMHDKFSLKGWYKHEEEVAVDRECGRN